MKRELWYSVVVRDRHGKVISRERRRARSFLKQWNQLVYVQMAQTTLDITDTGNTARSIDRHANNFAMNAAEAVTTYGIIVGTGITAVTISDYAVETPIAEGVGVGQMNYLVSTIATSVVAAPSCSFLVRRTIVNNSGATITVKEAGLYMLMESIPYYGCGARDVFGTPQEVPDSGSITVDWTIKVTV